MKRVLQSCSILLLLFSAAAHAELYKWVGPDGKITYSDIPPPPTATKVETRPAAGGSAVRVDLPFELEEAVKKHPVTLYTTQNCGPCNEGRKLLSQRGIPFTEKTVNTNDDIAQFRKVGGDSQLPLLIVGRANESGFEATAWNTALTAAGYPETSRLPRNYRNPPAEAAAPIPKAPETRQAEAASSAQTAEPEVTELPPATGNAPPGFRF